MRIISVSRGSQSLGIQFARMLADKLGYECISREDLLEEGVRRRIPIGKLETAIVKPHIQSDRLITELEHYKALSTSILCEKALDHDIVYHGRTGHLLLPGIDHVLRIRVVSDMEQRIAHVTDRLKLTRKKAIKYIAAVEDDRQMWAKRFYNVDWSAFTLYDLIVNLSHMSADNAASAVCTVAQLPEFQSTPSSKNALEDLLLAAKSRLMLAEDERTRNSNVAVTAERGVVRVTHSFLPQEVVGAIPDVLKQLPGAGQIICTEAQTNVLWIQEEFDAEDSSCDEVLALASEWDAAVDLIKLTPGSQPMRFPVAEEVAKRGLETWRRTGIIDESEDFGPDEPEDLSKIYERLVNSGRAGGKRVLTGTLRDLLKTIDRSVPYRLVVLDNIFMSKSPEVRKRSIQEWSNSLSETLKTPAVTLKDLKSQYRFGFRQVISMAITALLTCLVLFAIYTYEDKIIEFLLRDGTSDRILATVILVVFVPTFALIYSTTARLFLRALRID